MRVGSYEVAAEIGRGGMGVVLRARAPDGRDVAIKLIKADISERSRQRFDRERRLQAELGEANGFVPLLESGDGPQGPFMVMPFLAGGSLRSKLHSGPLPLPQVEALARVLARSLKAAHAKGVVHRDLKPENILIAADGRALVSDLGLAKHLDEKSLSGTRGTVVISKSGVMLGTFGYAPMEQLQDAKHAGPQADVFAVGAILYECLAGKPAFSGTGVAELILRVRDGRIQPLGSLRPELPSHFVLIIERALAKDAQDRWSDGSDLSRAIDSALGPLPPGPLPPVFAPVVPIPLMDLDLKSHAPDRSRTTERTSANEGAPVPVELASVAHGEPSSATFVALELPSSAGEKPLPGVDGGRPGTVANERAPLPSPNARTAPLEDAEPRTIGGYRIKKELGRGGMGVVYKAWHSKFARDVAIKVLLAGPQTPEEDIRRFEVEVRAAARLRHRNVVPIHEAGTDRGRPFFVMDLASGEVLDSAIAAGRIDERRALEITAKLALVLHHAHKEGVIHRDLKPGNVILEEGTGEPLLMDFGLARILGEATLTGSGIALGTPLYMSPEAAWGERENVGPRSDVYGLGAILYEMLTRKPPFVAENVDALMKLVTTAAPVLPRVHDPSVSPAAEAVCMKAMDKLPARRFEDAQALAVACREILERRKSASPLPPTTPASMSLPVQETSRKSSHEPAAPEPGKKRKPLVALGAALALVALPWAAFALRPFLDASSRESTLERARAEGLAFARDRKKEPTRVLESVEARLPSLKASEAPSVLQELEKAERTLEDEASVERELEAAVRGEAREELPREVLEETLAKARSELALSSLLARFSRAEARVLEVAGKRDEARSRRARAYRLDARGAQGSRALLELASEAVREGDSDRALAAARIAGARSAEKDVRGLADFVSGKASLALGEAEHAAALLARARSAHVLDAVQEKEARWLEAISRKLWHSWTAPRPAGDVLVRDLTGTGAAQVYVAKADEGLEVLACIPGQGLVPVARAKTALPAWHMTTVRTDQGELLVVGTHRGEEPFVLELYAFKGTSLELVRRVPVPVGRVNLIRVLAAGDIDGDGRPDVLLFFRKADDGARQVVLLSDVLGQASASPYMDGNAYVDHGAFGAFGDGGAPAVAVATGFWSGYELVLSSAGRERREIFRKRLGLPTALTLEPGGRSFLLAVDRERAHDALFDESLSPELPDAVYRVSPSNGSPRLETVLAHPFSEREGHVFTGACAPDRFLADFPGTVVASEDVRDERGTDSGRLVLVPPAGSGLEPFRVALPSTTDSLSGADLDGDGSGEIVLKSREGLVVLGLADPKNEAPRLPAEPSLAQGSPELAACLDLLEAGFPREAAAGLAPLAQATEEAASTPGSRVRAKLGLARARSELGAHAEACSLFLACADEDPLVAPSALLHAATEAEAAGDFAKALSCTGRLRSSGRGRSGEAELETRARRLRALGSLEEAVRIDRAALDDPSRDLLVEDPTLMRRTDRGMRFFARSSMSGLVTAPLAYDGSTFRISGRLFAEQVDWGTGFRVALEEVGTGRDEVSFHVDTIGGGNVDTFNRQVEFFSCGQWTTFRVEDFDPRSEVVFDALYVEQDARLELRIEHSGKTFRGRARLPHALDKGRYRLRVGLRSMDAGGPVQASFELLEVAIAAPRGAFSAVPPEENEKTAFARAGRAFFRDPKNAGETLSSLASQAKDPSVAFESAFLSELARARAGAVDEAASGLARVRSKDAAAFDAFYEPRIFAFAPEERDALAQACMKWSSADSRPPLERAQDLLRENHPAEAALLLGRATDARARLLQGVAWLSAGDSSTAFDLLAPLARQGDRDALAHAGLAAFRLHRLAEAGELWESLERSDPARVRPFSVELGRCRRLLR